MAKQTFTITIDSILGGHSQVTHFADGDQFIASTAIDPSSYAYSLGSGNGGFGRSSGLLRPMPALEVDAGKLSGTPLWIHANPRTAGTQDYFVYCANGSVYTMDVNLSLITGLTDLNDGGSAKANGMAYYDNYMYFARDTTVARYGPLNGTPAFTDDYWVATLGKTALTNTTYPQTGTSGSPNRHPNHVLHRHSDGKLYIADVVGNQGTIHYIKTTKTTVEGDTDDGSSYDKVNVGNGLYPTAMESYGSMLAIGFIETQENLPGSYSDSATTGKIAFWDTTSQNVNEITWVEFPDPYISAIKNINGVLYVVSGNLVSSTDGFRLSRYVGGGTFEEVFLSENGFPPLPGAIDGLSNQLIFGSTTKLPSSGSPLGSVYSYGLKKAALGNGLHNIFRITKANGFVTALRMDRSRKFANQTPIVGWYSGPGPDDYGIDSSGAFSSTSGYGNSNPEWFSQIYKIGQPFKITKIRIPLADRLSSLMNVNPVIWTDTLLSSQSLTAINSTNFGTTKKSVVIRPQALTGDNDFVLQLQWTGTQLCTISLPITIEGELLNVDQNQQ